MKSRSIDGPGTPKWPVGLTNEHASRTLKIVTLRKQAGGLKNQLSISLVRLPISRTVSYRTQLGSSSGRTDCSPPLVLIIGPGFELSAESGLGNYDAATEAPPRPDGHRDLRTPT